MRDEASCTSTFDPRIGFGFDRWELTLFSNNFTNKKGVAGAQGITGLYTDYFINRPRTTGASLRFDL